MAKHSHLLPPRLAMLSLRLCNLDMSCPKDRLDIIKTLRMLLLLHLLVMELQLLSQVMGNSLLMVPPLRQVSQVMANNSRSVVGTVSKASNSVYIFW